MLKSRKNLIILIMFLTVASFVVANFVFAQVNVGAEYGAQIGLSNTDPRIIIARVIQVALGFLGIIAVCLIMYAGWLWMTSEGSEEKIEQAKNILKNAIIGLIIILSSFAIASFVLNKLMGASVGGGIDAGGGPGGGAGGGIGVLGSCTVESVYPEPSQTERPRNTSIIVTFREEVKPETIMGGDGKILPGGNVKIYRDNKGDPAPAAVTDFIKDVKVASTDNKTFVFTPSAPLGSVSEASVWYTAYLSNNIKKKASGDGIFKTCSKDYLEWNFEVNNKLDLDPPQVNAGGVSPLPSSDPTVKNPTNSVIQINFSEAINPITVSGSADDVKNYIKVVNMTTDPTGYLKGRFIVSNQYKTVEFLSDNECGVNGCGEKIYCLPASSQIKVELNAATLAACADDNTCLAPYDTCTDSHCQNKDTPPKNYPAAALPANGIIDIASNSLDGNRNKSAAGPISFYNENSPVADTGDNYQWSFSTSAEADLTPPVISSVSPNFNASGASLSEPITITFSKAMMSDSLGSGFTEVSSKDAAGNDVIVKHKKINLWNSSSPEQPGYWTASPSPNKAEIRHSIFKDTAGYTTQVGSGVKDSFQNCFKPSSGPNSSSGCIGAPSCCNGNSTGTLSADGNCP